MIKNIIKKNKNLHFLFENYNTVQYFRNKKCLLFPRKEKNKQISLSLFNIDDNIKKLLLIFLKEIKIQICFTISAIPTIFRNPQLKR